MTRPLALVTGASSGIGAATARALAAAGHEVVCAARRTDRIADLAAEIDGRAVTCDVTDPDAVAALAAEVGDRLDVLVNNAGGAYGLDPVATGDVEDWRAMYEVNVIGTLRVVQACSLRSWRPRGSSSTSAPSRGAPPTRAAPATPRPSTRWRR